MSQDSLAPAVVYKPIEGFPGYRVGDDGSVWTCRRPGPGGAFREQWLKMYPRQRKDGYIQIGLYRDGKHHHRFVHRVVLEAFVGPCPAGMEACHFPDRSKENNRLGNLAWKTKKANSEDKSRHGTQPQGERVYCAKLSDSLVVEIRSKRGSATCDELAAEYGVNRTTINDIHRRKTWKHI